MQARNSDIISKYIYLGVHVYNLVTIGIFRKSETGKTLFKDFVPDGHLLRLGQTLSIAKSTKCHKYHLQHSKCVLLPVIKVLEYYWIKLTWLFTANYFFGGGVSRETRKMHTIIHKKKIWHIITYNFNIIRALTSGCIHCGILWRLKYFHWFHCL